MSSGTAFAPTVLLVHRLMLILFLDPLSLAAEYLPEILIGPPKWFMKSESEVTQSCPTLCDPMDCSLPGSSLHGILQARILEWVAISFSRGSSRPRDQTWVSRILGRHCNF